ASTETVSVEGQSGKLATRAHIHARLHRDGIPLRKCGHKERLAYNVPRFPTCRSESGGPRLTRASTRYSRIESLRYCEPAAVRLTRAKACARTPHATRQIPTRFAGQAARKRRVSGNRLCYP